MGIDTSQTCPRLCAGDVGQVPDGQKKLSYQGSRIIMADKNSVVLGGDILNTGTHKFEGGITMHGKTMPTEGKWILNHVKKG